jgi:hypothetical protein
MTLLMCLLRPQYLEEYFPLLSQKKQKNIFKRVTVKIIFLMKDFGGYL